MVQSMTGFGRAELNTPNGSIRVEVKTTNHKYNDISIRTPQSLLSYEEDIRKIIQKKVKRGKLHLLVVAPDSIIRKNKISVNESLAKEYKRAFQKLNGNLGLKDKVSLNQILRMPDVVTATTSQDERAKIWNKLKQGLDKALSDLVRSRQREGQALKKDLSKRLTLIQKSVQKIKSQGAKALISFKKKLEKRFKSELKLDNYKDRINQEVAGYLKGTDTTEEMVRLKSHLVMFRQTLQGGNEIGKKIDFIAQEMMREVNTSAAKSNDAIISKEVIEIKTELEKIREQAQNLV